MQRQLQLAVLGLSETSQTTVLHLLDSFYPTHRTHTLGQSADSWVVSAISFAAQYGETLDVAVTHAHSPTAVSGDEQLRWTSGSGLHRTDELGSTDTAVLAVEGSLGRVCAADAHKLGLAAAQLAAAGVSEVLLAVTNCPPTLRSFDCTGLPVPPEKVHLLPSTLFSLFADRLALTLDQLEAVRPDWDRVSTAVHALLCAAAHLHSESRHQQYALTESRRAAPLADKACPLPPPQLRPRTPGPAAQHRPGHLPPAPAAAKPAVARPAPQSSQHAQKPARPPMGGPLGALQALGLYNEDSADDYSLADFANQMSAAPAPVLHEWDAAKRTRTRPQAPSKPAAAQPHRPPPGAENSPRYGVRPNSAKGFTVQATQVKDLDKVIGPAGATLAAIEQKTQSRLTIPEGPPLPGKGLTIAIRSVDAEGNEAARQLIKAAMKGEALSL